MPIWREAREVQHVYELVTFEVHHGGRIVKNKHNKGCHTGGSIGYLDWCLVEYINMLEMWEQVKLLGHMGKVSLKGVVNDELLDIDANDELLSLCDKVGVALNEDIGPLNNDENRAFTKGNRPLNNDKDKRPFTEDHGPACTVQDWDSSDDDGPLNNDGNRADIGETDVEDRNEDTKEEDKEDDPDFVDSAYEQSENECELLKKDDKAFENYVDHPKSIEDPNAPIDEDGESTDVAKSDVHSLDSRSNDEDDGNHTKRKRKLPKFEEFRPETDMRNPVFKLGLRFATTNLFRKAIRNYSIINKRMIKFKFNDCDMVRAVCARNCKWVCFSSAVNGSEWVQVKKLIDVHDCGTVDHNFHANSTWLAQRYATQLSRMHNWDMGTFKHYVREYLSVIASKSQIYRVRQKATSITERTYEKQYELLWDYAAELRRTNMGSTVIIKCELEADRPRFQRIYICLAAVKQGFL
ncbi:uncharacterized protein Pyn_04362 [Prunus yedoensis var. nudiflora]|uniref:Transposase MuDR plant domain-containing protein n=1 Tax=Prunus yedoensis var. nudiflora TaxID=2094558 RepID=A0A314YLL5_PRUYE|nr:uncharacterized protein Pyn_04362 [Prunus yedoensis var. nudiflora]